MVQWQGRLRLQQTCHPEPRSYRPLDARLLVHQPEARQSARWTGHNHHSPSHPWHPIQPNQQRARHQPLPGHRQRRQRLCLGKQQQRPARRRHHHQQERTNHRQKTYGSIKGLHLHASQRCRPPLSGHRQRRICIRLGTKPVWRTRQQQHQRLTRPRARARPSPPQRPQRRTQSHTSQRRKLA